MPEITSVKPKSLATTKQLGSLATVSVNVVAVNWLTVGGAPYFGKHGRGWPNELGANTFSRGRGTCDDLGGGRNKIGNLGL